VVIVRDAGVLRVPAHVNHLASLFEDVWRQH
jgi:hypothetical protein